MNDVGLPPRLRVNLDQSVVLLVDDNPQALDIMGSVFQGFGVKQQIKCASAIEAVDVVKTTPLDLIVIDCSMPEMDGYDFVRWLRRSDLRPAAFTPTIMVTGHPAQSKVEKSRDCGASFVVSKPITPAVLLERMVWVAREDRPFIVCDAYAGPDRRFKNEGPPIGVAPRRRDDLSFEVGEAVDPNLAQAEIDLLLKPTKAPR